MTKSCIERERLRNAQKSKKCSWKNVSKTRRMKELPSKFRGVRERCPRPNTAARFMHLEIQ